ncbi:MAG: CRTAC1 family protein [Thermoanaerobaculia bacterium]|nr:CRTAC1 family protein [Thermoanaerobaculia bacterium]
MTARPPRPPLASAALALLVLLPATLTAQRPADPQILPIPQIDWGWEMLEVREWLQRQTTDRFEVVHDFELSDRRQASGITFRNEATADSGKFYQPNHYDHGNGVAVADVDGDGRYDVYFVTQLGSNELWRNLGGGRFENVTESAGVGLGDRLGVTASFADVDNDGDPDLFVTTVRTGNALFENDGTGRFQDVTERAGLAYSGHSSGAAFFDYDGDGWLDLLLVNVGVYTTDQRTDTGYWAGIAPDAQGRDAFSGHLFPERTEKSILYRNLGGGRFVDVSEATGFDAPGWNGDAAFADLNGDGRPDLYLPNMQGDDNYFENRGAEGWTERTAELFPKTPWGTMGVDFFDLENDGDLDLLLTDMHSDMSRKVTPGYEKAKSLMTWDDATLQGGDNNIFGNALYVNPGDGGVWAERSDELGAENYWPWGVSVEDLNADGWEDVFIASSMNFPYTYGVNTVLLNNRGEKLLDSEFILGVEPRDALTERPWYDPRAPWLVTKRPWFELDCPGADARHRLCQGRPARLSVWGNVGSRSSAIFDLDDDGDLDIVTNEFHDFPQVLVSDLAQRHQIRWIKIRLRGRESNRDGLGAWVRVHAGGRVLTRYHNGKSGYLSQSSLPLYVGLGDATSVEKVEVVWPSGAVQTVTEGIEVNSTLEIEEGG